MMIARSINCLTDCLMPRHCIFFLFPGSNRFDSTYRPCLSRPPPPRPPRNGPHRLAPNASAHTDQPPSDMPPQIDPLGPAPSDQPPRMSPLQISPLASAPSFRLSPIGTVPSERSHQNGPLGTVSPERAPRNGLPAMAPSAPPTVLSPPPDRPLRRSPFGSAPWDRSTWRSPLGSAPVRSDLVLGSDPVHQDMDQPTRSAPFALPLPFGAFDRAHNGSTAQSTPELNTADVRAPRGPRIGPFWPPSARPLRSPPLVLLSRLDPTSSVPSDRPFWISLLGTSPLGLNPLLQPRRPRRLGYLRSLHSYRTLRLGPPSRIGPPFRSAPWIDPLDSVPSVGPPFRIEPSARRLGSMPLAWLPQFDHLGKTPLGSATSKSPLQSASSSSAPSARPTQPDVRAFPRHARFSA